MAYTTVSEALAAYNANLDWDNDPAKAAICLQAVRFLLMNRAMMQSVAGASLSFADLAHERDRLEEFVQITSTTSRRCSWTRGRVPR